ncbi:MAG: antibiotic biosynthesis monooxygenase [Rhodobacteraceae bacterium CG17_big_fil_post_rev_8_21_14_2_50_65_11]|nr:MAG: antibiotic biosynthesis monooxygenase [Rhodobacteraceae bacterium CG17_big_fil_post_rev_8_21_14_2_50_65_11]
MADILHVIARIKAAPETLEELVASMRIMVAEVRQEPGCLRYDLTQSEDDPTVLVFVEEWASRADWDVHMAGDALARHSARTRPEMVREIEVHALGQIA